MPAGEPMRAYTVSPVIASPSPRPPDPLLPADPATGPVGGVNA